MPAIPPIAQNTLKWFFRLLWFGVLKWAFDNFAWDAVVQVLEKHLGIKEADVITSVLSLVIPAGIAIVATAGAYWLGKHHRQPIAVLTAAPLVTPASEIGAPALTSAPSEKPALWPYATELSLNLGDDRGQAAAA